MALRQPVGIARIASIRCFQRHLLPRSKPSKLKLKLKSSSSSSSHKCIDDERDSFLLWFRRKAGAEISSVLSMGHSNHGRSLFASKSIKAGECILKVPYSAQLAPDNLPPKLNSFLGDKVGNVAKLALVILMQQQLGQNSEWAPYINFLPHAREMHSTLFWSDDELKAIKNSSLYQETIKRNEEIEKDFLVIKPVLDQFPENFEDVSLKNFKHAYGLDFLNHDSGSESDVMCFEDEEVTEVEADRSYAPGDQVLIRYGKFSNATLLLDFGFTLPRNKYDQVQLEFMIPQCDPLQSIKSELLHSDTTPTVKDCNGLTLQSIKSELLHGYTTPTVKDCNGLRSSKNCFTIKNVRSATGKGKGIPQSLRAFFRVLCCTTPQARRDGRIARSPFKNRAREIQAHQLLLSRINQKIDEHNAFIKSLDSPLNALYFAENLALRMQLARELLAGELRVLESASAWLTNYCTNLMRNT